jgi:hypothetical protein
MPRTRIIGARVRRCLRVSVRTVLVINVLLAVLIAWPMNRAYTKRQAVAAIREAGGHAFGNRCVIVLPPHGTRWLRSVLGDEFFEVVIGVDLQGKGVDRELMTWIGKLDQLKDLNLQGARFDGADLIELQNLPGLSTLNLASTGIGDEALGSVTGFTSLQGLNLEYTKVTDAGLAGISRLVHLCDLNLNGTRVGDDTLARLERLTQLSQLSLAGTAVTDAGLAHLVDLPNLELLSLSRTRVGDPGMAHLARLKLNSFGQGGCESLRLVLDETNVGDEGAAHLARLRQLRSVNLGGTRVTELGVTGLLSKKYGFGSMRIWGMAIDADGLARIKRRFPKIIRTADVWEL